VHQLFIDFKIAYDSIRREIFYYILIDFDIPMKLVRLVKTRLPKTYSRVRVGKILSDIFPNRNDMKQIDTLSPLFFNFALEYVIRSVQVNQDGFKLNGTLQFLIYAGDVNTYNGRKCTYYKRKLRSFDSG
jgi:hypothetical protein